MEREKDKPTKPEIANLPTTYETIRESVLAVLASHGQELIDRYGRRPVKKSDPLAHKRAR